ncbi:hypothetical protein [Halochromatium salexigens]|uniref:Uncharacterized protein n=1 Tax=Halochromatium salexigens TaxID=49447 RepID=A0AAJ0UF48_HALSE|nr:hypothetical protein [Halochromatium salexigens]MBK5929452.1 hypothetical protein [Halochromatium salexigens]
MKRLILSASAATLALASMTAAAWWSPPYAGPFHAPYAYGTPYAVAPPSPQQLRQMTKRQREAAIERMETHRQAMDARRNAHDLPMPERPDFMSAQNLPEPPTFGERPAMPEMPTFGERPAIPEIPGYDDLPAMPEFSLNPEERKAEIDAYRTALKQQADARRAAMQAIAEQRRALAEQRRQDRLCNRQARRPMPYAAPARDCASESNKSEADSNVESNDQTVDSAPASNQAS